MRESALRQQIVSQAVRELRERVRSERRDDEQVGVVQVRVGVLALRLPGEREERLRGYEALGALGQERIDVVAGSDEQPHEGAGLVGRDPAGDSDQDACHLRAPA